MKIEWNKVTWYSKIIALILFVSLPFIGFCLGVSYQRNISTGEKTTNIKSYSNSCKAGEVALFEGGIFAGCVNPTNTNETSGSKSEAGQINSTTPPSATTSSTSETTKTYPNPCGNGEVALYEGGVFSACAKPAQ